MIRPEENRLASDDKHLNWTPDFIALNVIAEAIPIVNQFIEQCSDA